MTNKDASKTLKTLDSKLRFWSIAYHGFADSLSQQIESRENPISIEDIDKTADMYDLLITAENSLASAIEKQKPNSRILNRWYGLYQRKQEAIPTTCIRCIAKKGGPSHKTCNKLISEYFSASNALYAYFQKMDSIKNYPKNKNDPKNDNVVYLPSLRQ